MTNETWQKRAIPGPSGLAYLEISTLKGWPKEDITAWLLPESLVDAIIADHQQVAAFPFTLKVTSQGGLDPQTTLCWKGDGDGVYAQDLRAEVIKWLEALALTDAESSKEI